MTLLTTLVVLALALTIIVVGVSALRGASASQAPAEAAPIPVATFTVNFDAVATIETRFPGLVAARRESMLGFDSGGRIADITVDVGDTVSAGDVLARLDTRTLEAQLEAARADASAAAAQGELAQLTLDRQRTLVAQGHVSAQRLDESEANARAALAQAHVARAAVQALEVRIDLARVDAPFDGVVTTRNFDQGSVVAPGVPILTLVEAGVLEVRVGLPAEEAAHLRPGEDYTLEASGAEMTARLRTTTGVVDRQSRSVTAIFDVAADVGLASGQVVRLVIPTELEDRGFWAPVTALAEGRRGLWSVYVLAGDTAPFSLEPRPVELLHTDGDRVYLNGAVGAGETVLAAGLQRVTAGQMVIPAQEG